MRNPSISKLCTLSAFLFGGVLISFPCIAKESKLDACIDWVCVNKKQLTLKVVREKKGWVQPYSDIGFEQSRSACFYNSSIGFSIVVSVSGDGNPAARSLNSIFLTKVKLCDAAPKGKSVLPITGKGIELGSSSEGLEKKIGQPIRIDNALEREKKDSRYTKTPYASRYGVTRLHYENNGGDPFFNEFCLDDKKIIASIWINDSP